MMKNNRENLGGGLVCIKTFNSRAEAEVAKGMLEAHGIQAFLSGDDAGGLYPAMPQVGIPIRLMIKEADLETAKNLLEK